MDDFTESFILEGILLQLINEEPDKFKRVREKPEMKGWFIGRMKQRTCGRARPSSIENVVDNYIKYNGKPKKIVGNFIVKVEFNATDINMVNKNTEQNYLKEVLINNAYNCYGVELINIAQLNKDKE